MPRFHRPAGPPFPMAIPNKDLIPGRRRDFQFPIFVQIPNRRGRRHHMLGRGRPPFDLRAVAFPHKDAIVIRADNHFWQAIFIDIRERRGRIDEQPGRFRPAAH